MQRRTKLKAQSKGLTLLIQQRISPVWIHNREKPGTAQTGRGGYINQQQLNADIYF